MLALASGISWLEASPVSPAAETLLPSNTVAAITTPDFPAFLRMARSAPLVRFWNDPAMTAFTAGASESWKREVLAPLTGKFGIPETNLLAWCEGQVTIALTGGPSQNDRYGVLLLLDSRTRSSEVSAALDRLRREATNSSGPLRIGTIGTTRFLIMALEEAPVSSAPAGAKATHTEVFLGQVNSWLIAGTRQQDIEQVCLALQGTNLHANFTTRYGTHHPVVIPAAPVYAWMEAGPLLQAAAREFSLPPTAAAGPVADVTLETLIQATGLGKLRTLFFSAQSAPGGFLYQMTWTVPESGREGLIKLLAAEAKPCAIPDFAPSDIVEFDRWRVDGRKAWSTLQQIFNGISPHWTNSAALILETANAAARLKDPAFNIHTNLFGNLGDDLIVMEKPPRDLTSEAMDSPPTLYLMGSANPPQLASALGSVFIFLDREAETPREHAFAGHTIRSVPLPALALAEDAAAPNPARQRLHYAPAQGYVALSTDETFLEEFLAATNSPASNSLNRADFPNAFRQVVGPETGLFGFNHRLNLVRALWPAVSGPTNALPTSQLGSGFGFLPGLLGVALPAGATNWFDARLLPAAGLLEKYFHYTVYGGGATTNGITWRMFEPTPPGLK